MSKRTVSLERTTKETSIGLTLNLDGAGKADIQTGLGFLDHMLGALAKHGAFDIELQCSGDLEVDDHHTAEDCAIVLGQAFDQALGDRRGVKRFAHAYAPLDEALARAVVDLSGRPCAVIDLQLQRDAIGNIACENLHHIFVSFAQNCKGAVHVDVLKGENDHHRVEAAFKALALALREAVRLTGSDEIPSTKGVL